MKAFIVKQQGIILGVDLDAETACWRIPADSSSISRLDMERMLGMTQQVTNMLPVLKPLTFPCWKRSNIPTQDFAHRSLRP